jgi:uncharacterized lipoprotein
VCVLSLLQSTLALPAKTSLVLLAACSQSATAERARSLRNSSVDDRRRVKKAAMPLPAVFTEIDGEHDIMQGQLHVADNKVKFQVSSQSFYLLVHDE